MNTIFNTATTSTGRMKTYIYIIMSAAAATLLSAACTGKNTQADAEKQLTAVERGRVGATETVQLRSIDDELVLNGDVACDEALLRKVFVPCTGRVGGIAVEVGDKVERGQRLATVHSEGAAEYRKSLSDADAEIRMAQRQYDMQQDMHKSGMASDKDLEEAHERLLTANGRRMAAVPSQAVIFEDGKDYVVVLSRGKYHRRQVSVARASGGYSFIASGVEPGEEVVVKNALLYFNASANE